MAIQESGEMYLETILVLSKSHPAVRAIDICEEMGFSKPSVSRALGILKADGYVISDANGHLTLTDSGKAIAEKIYERHTLLSQFLINLGVDPKIAAEDACKIEHHISDQSFEAIKRHAKSNAKAVGTGCEDGAVPVAAESSKATPSSFESAE